MRLNSSLFAVALLVAAMSGTVPAASQELAVSCTISLPDETATAVVFGLSASAASGIDALDEPLPPAAPGERLRAYLLMPEAPAPGLQQWRREFRPFLARTADRSVLWTMTIESAVGGVPLRLVTALEVLDAPPYTLTLLAPDGAEIPVVPGEVIEIPGAAPVTSVCWLLTYDEQVPDDLRTWGGTKTLFR